MTAMAYNLVTWISRKQKPVARFKMIAQVIKDKMISSGAAMLKSVEERLSCRDNVGDIK